jgi:YgiT-type zinc finger domain-containing protein
MTTKTQKKYNYGECEICGTLMRQKAINQDFWIQDKLVIVEGIPAGVCPKCGEKVVTSEVGKFIEKLIGNEEIIKNAPKIYIPKVKFRVEIIKV